MAGIKTQSRKDSDSKSTPGGRALRVPGLPDRLSPCAGRSKPPLLAHGAQPQGNDRGKQHRVRPPMSTSKNWDSFTCECCVRKARAKAGLWEIHPSGLTRERAPSLDPLYSTPARMPAPTGKAA